MGVPGNCKNMPQYKPNYTNTSVSQSKHTYAPTTPEVNCKWTASEPQVKQRRQMRHEGWTKVNNKYPNGEVYEGEWQDDKKNGSFIHTQANGTTSREEWLNGVKQNQGSRQQ